GKRAATQFANGEFLYVGSTSASSSEQNRLIENLIAQKVDAISVSVLDPSINAVLKKAQDAGIKVFTSDSDGPDSVREVFVAQATDELLGRTLMDRLALQINNTGEVGIVSGESTAVNLNSWIEWMKRQATEKYPNITIVDVRYTSGGSTEDALKQSQELMTRYPNIKGLVAVASTTVPGVARAVEQANKVGSVAVIGYGSPATVKPYIESGVMKESILWDPEALGFLTYWAGMKLAKGETFEAENNIEGLKDPVRYYPEQKMLLLGNPLVIDKENVATFNF
ncbi:MAG: autoinducer 2 ABC transporter substrate-binding protein, partial [Brevinema sp.]